MATGLDIVAGSLGIIGVAQQLTASIIKIKSFCKDVKDAPEELLDTISSIENFNNILMRLGEHQDRRLQQMKNDYLLHESVALCEKATDRIASLANHLQLGIERRTYRGSIKAVLKKKEVKAMLEKLDRSKFDLHFAYSLFTEACRQDDAKDIRRYFEEDRDQRTQILLNAANRALCGAKDDEDRASEKVISANKSRTYSGQRFRTSRIRLPGWLCRYAWDVAFVRASGQWTVSLKAFKIIDHSHPVRKLIRHDDVSGIRRLLEDRQLSVHDQISNMGSLMDCAIEKAAVKTIEFLMERHVAVAEAFRRSYDWNGFLLNSWDSMPEEGSSNHFEDYHQWLRSIDAAREIARKLEQCSDQDVSPYLQAILKPPSCWTGHDRLNLLDAIEPAFYGNPVLYGILGTSTINNETSNRHSKDATTGLQFLASYCARMTRDKASEVTWANAVERQAHERDQISSHGGRSCTSFMSLLFSGLWAYWNSIQMNDIIHLWVSALSKAGADLLEYGKTECQYIRQNYGLVNEMKTDLGLLTITYGSRPEDWEVWLHHPGDVYAGILWELVENSHKHVPGAWVEEDVNLFDAQRSGRTGRRIGIKRRTLRRMKAVVKSTSSCCPIDIADVAALWRCVDVNARHYTGDAEEDPDEWSNRDEMLALATSLGITTDEFRSYL